MQGFAFLFILLFLFSDLLGMKKARWLAAPLSPFFSVVDCFNSFSSWFLAVCQLSGVYHHIESEDFGSTYLPMVSVMSDEDLKQQAISYSLQYLQQARKRLAEIREMEKVVAKIEEIEKELDTKTKHQVKPSKKIVGKPKGLSAVT